MTAILCSYQAEDI